MSSAARVKILPVMTKLSPILRSEYANNEDFVLSPEKELTRITILPSVNIIYSTVIHLVFMISQHCLVSPRAFKVTIESLLYKRGQPFLNKDKEPLLFKYLDS